MKAQVVEYGGQYAARIKAWYQLKWSYVGEYSLWTKIKDAKHHCLVDSIQEASDRLDVYTKPFKVVQ